MAGMHGLGSWKLADDVNGMVGTGVAPHPAQPPVIHVKSLVGLSLPALPPALATIPQSHLPITKVLSRVPKQTRCALPRHSVTERILVL
jgi:hypothetical protein